MRSGDKGSDDNTKKIRNYLDTFIEDDKVNGDAALLSAKKANEKNLSSTEYLKELASAKHSVIFYTDAKGVKASLFSCEGDTEAEVMLPPQVIKTERIHAIDSVAILAATRGEHEKASKSTQKKYDKNKKLIMDIFHTIINNPETVVLSAGEGRVGNIIATVTPDKLSLKNGSVKAGQYNLTEMFKNVDLTDLNLNDDDLNQAVNYFVQNKHFFMLRPYIHWAPDNWPAQPSKEDWSKYFQNKIEDDRKAGHELHAYDTHLAHQLGINSQSTGIFHLSNGLLRDTTSTILPNAESILNLKKGKLNSPGELASALMQAFVTGILVVDAINKHSDTFECVVRGETDSVKAGTFEDRGISSVGYGKNTFLETQFIPSIEKSNSAHALINAIKILEVIDVVPSLGTQDNLDALEREIKWMKEEDKNKFFDMPDVKERIDNLKQNVKNTGILSGKFVAPISNVAPSLMQPDTNENFLAAHTSSGLSERSQSVSFSDNAKKNTSLKMNTPLVARNMFDSIDDFVVSHAGGSKAKWNTPKDMDISVPLIGRGEKPKPVHHGDALAKALEDVFAQLNQVEGELKVMTKKLERMSP